VEEYSTFGRHVAMDAWGVPFNLLNNVDELQKYMVQAAESCGASILSVQAQKFDPQGVTVLVMLSESHLSIHTYPEKGFAALDCYTCGHTVDPQIAIDYMIAYLKPSQTFAKALKRGDGPIVNLAKPMIERSKKVISL
jgi:S-adenosylmethionine decarboxylase